ncbi:MAG TPA: hypothetical protein VFS43_44750 [Polyangiaceae bacterium]|nr:hypothetical protein [Polyangiaceae bacterium]
MASAPASPGGVAAAPAPGPSQGGPPAPAGRVRVVTVPPRPEDVASVEGLVKAFYEVVNVPPEGARQWDRDRTLYSPHIRFIAIDGKGKVSVWDHQQLVESTEPLVAQGFREREIWRVTRRYGNMAHVDSTYETLRGPGGRDVSRGVNSIDAYFDGGRWWIASVVWQSESARYPIPPELLPPASRR